MRMPVTATVSGWTMDRPEGATPIDADRSAANAFEKLNAKPLSRYVVSYGHSRELSIIVALPDTAGTVIVIELGSTGSHVDPSSQLHVFGSHVGRVCWRPHE